MPVLATGVTDPDFYQRKIAQMTQGLSSLAAGFRARKAQKEAEADAEIGNFTSAVATLPELANTWGVELQKKYATTHPGVGPLVDALRSRRAIESQVEDAGKKFYSTWDQLASEHKRRGEELDSLPDEVATGLGPIPNFNKQKMRAEFDKIDATRLAQAAASTLSPSELAAARVWAKKTYSQDLPEEEHIDWFNVMPKDQATLWGILQGKIDDPTGDILNSLRYKLGISQSPKRLQEQGFQATQSETSQTAALKKAEETDRQIREREVITHQHSLERIQANKTAQRGSAATGRGSTEKKKKEAGFTHKDLLRDNAAQISDWQAGFTAAGAQETNQARAAQARAAYSKANPRPPRLTDSEARAITRIARDSPGEPVDTIAQATSIYQQAKKAGKNGAEALGVVKRGLEVTSTPSPTGTPLVRPQNRTAGSPPQAGSTSASFDPAAAISARVEEYSHSLTQEQKRKAIANLQNKYRSLVASGLAPQDAINKVFQ